MMKKLLLLLTILLVASSCAPLRKGAEQPSAEMLGLVDGIRVLADRRKEALKGFEVEADVHVECPDIKFKSQALIIGWRPCFLHLECLGPFNQPFLSFSTDGEHFDLLSAVAMKCYDGDLSSPTVRFLIPKGLMMQDIYCWFLGEYNFENRRAISFSRDAGASLVVFQFLNEHSGMTEEVWVDPKDGLVKKALLRNSHGKVVVTIEHEAFVERDGLSYPDSFSLCVPASGLRLQLNYKKLSLLSEKPSEAFSIGCPSEFKHKTMD